ncbi:MAG: NAD(P)-dependent oxidoreductase [bacterium]
MKILITGATGFIGSNLVKFLSEGNNLYCLTRSEINLPEGNNVKWIRQDLSDDLSYSRLPKNLDVIIHLAQSRHYKEFPKEVFDIFDINVRSTLTLLEYGRKVGIKKIILASSGGIYGYSYEKFAESSIITPVNFYLSSKYCAELLTANYKDYFSTVVFRLFFVYGEGQKNMLFPRLIESIKNDQPISIYGKEGVKINPIYIRDVVKTFKSALDYSVKGIFNIGGDEEISIKALAELIGKSIGKKPKFTYQQTAYPGDILGDNSKMKAILKVSPEINLKEGIKRMLEFEEC